MHVATGVTRQRPSDPTSPTFRDYIRLARRSGLRRAWMYFWQNHFFDLRHQTSTAHWQPKSAYSPALPNLSHGYHYEASYTSEILRCLRIVARTVRIEEFDFVDLGCGKGKALLVAARAGFRKMTGVEYEPVLADIARANLNAMAIEAEVIEADAADFRGYGQKCVVYLFNPFDSDVLGTVLGRIRASANECIIVYTNPVHIEVLSDWDFVEATDGPHTSLKSRIYRWRVASGDAEIGSKRSVSDGHR